MYTSIFPFKKITTDTDSRKHDYWAAIDSPAHNIQRVLAFHGFDKLKGFLKGGVFENGTTVDLRPYTLIQLKYDDALFAGKKQSLFGFAEKGQQPTSLPDYPSGLLDNFRDGQPLSEEDLRQCRFYMGFDKAQAVAEGLEARLQRNFSDDERQTIIAALGSIPIKNGNGHEKHNGVYGILPNMALHDLVSIYVRSLAENGTKPHNQIPYQEALNYISRPFIRFIVDDLSKKGATQIPKNGIMHEKSYSPLAALVLIVVYSAIFRMDKKKGPDNESDILDGHDLQLPDEKTPEKPAHFLDAIVEKLTGHLGIDLPPRPFG